MAKKPKAWAGFKGTLPQWEPEDKEWLDKVNEFGQTIATKSMIDLATEYRDLRKEKEDKEEEIKTLNIKLEAYNNQLLDRLENSDQENIKLKSGELFYIEDTPYTTVVDPDENIKWFEENAPEMVKENVNWSSQNALVKERLKNGQPLPSGAKVFMKSTVKMRKG